MRLLVRSIFLIIVVFCIVLPMTVFAQSDLFKQAQELTRKGQFKEANAIYGQASVLFYPDPNIIPQEQPDRDAAGWYIKCRLEIARNLSAAGDHGASMDSLNRLLPVAVRLLGAEAPTVARVHNSLGQVAERMGNYSEALKRYRQTLAIYQPITGEKHINVALLYNNIGVALDYLANYDSALFYKRKSLDLQIELSGGNDRTQEMGELYNAIGVTYDNKGDYDNAISYYNKSLSILTGILPEKDPVLADTYDNLGIAYDHIGDHSNAFRYKNKALAIREGKPSVALARSYLNLGQSAGREKKYNEAKVFYEKAIATFERFGDTLGIASTWLNMGRDFGKAGNYKDAENYLFSALKTGLDKLGSKSPQIAENYIALAELLEKRSEDQHNVFEFKDSKTGQSMNAVDFYQKALQSVVPSFTSNDYNQNPKADALDILSDDFLFKALKGKAHALVTLYKYRCFNIHNSEDADCNAKMNASAITYKAAHELKISILRRKNAGEFSALETIQESVDLYDDAIAGNLLHKVNLQKLYEAATDSAEKKKLFNKLKNVDKNIFQYSEYCKSALLIRQINLKKAQSHLTDSLKYISGQLNRKQKDLALELVKGARGNKDNIRKMQSDIFQLKKDYDNIMVAIDAKGAESFKDKPADLKALQEMLKKNPMDTSIWGNGNKAVVEFFMGKSTMTTIYITQNDFRVFNKTYDRAKLDAKVRNFRNTIIGMDLKKYVNIGYDLFNELFRERKDSNTVSTNLDENNPFVYDLFKIIKRDGVKEIYFLPDNFLFSVPFEALLTDKIKLTDADSEKDFRNLPFLIRDSIIIQYAYSARLMTESHAENKNSQSNFTKRFLGLAPVFKEEDQQVFGRKIVSPLVATEDEVLKIRSVFDEKIAQPNQTDIYLNRDATLNKVLSNPDLSRYEVIHFATHGFVYPETPERSGILLYPNEGEGKDGMFYMPEIAQQNIKADLVVLSACETGLGKVENGEGIKGLTRALIQAGANNVIVSLWSVADESTKELMIAFYRNLLKEASFLELNGERHYGRALLRAKFRLMQSKKFASPFYWAPFVLVE